MFNKEKFSLYRLVDMNKIKEQYSLNGLSLGYFSVSARKTVLLLFTHWAASSYRTKATVVELTVDWESVQQIDCKVYPLSTIPLDSIDFIDTIGEDFLLVSSRCYYDEEPAVKNAVIVHSNGQLVRRFCLGDKIENCVARADGTIITSYFDEGIFSLDKANECARGGVASWSSHGELLWKNQDVIVDDCYAMALDEQEDLWFYYYTDFHLAHTNFQMTEQFSVPIKGSTGFAVFPNRHNFLFRGGYDHGGRFYLLSRDNGELRRRKAIIFTENGKQITVKNCNLLRPKILCLSNKDILYAAPLCSD